MKENLPLFKVDDIIFISHRKGYWRVVSIDDKKTAFFEPKDLFDSFGRRHSYWVDCEVGDLKSQILQVVQHCTQHGKKINGRTPMGIEHGYNYGHMVCDYAITHAKEERERVNKLFAILGET